MTEIEIIQLVNTMGVPAVLMIWLFRQERHHAETLAYYRRKEAFYINAIVSYMSGKKSPTFDPDPEIDADTLPNISHNNKN